MKKIEMYVESFGGTYVEGYEALLDMGELRESDSLLRRCERIDKNLSCTNYCH